MTRSYATSPPPPTPTPSGKAHASLRVALAHDWLYAFRGGEAVLERIARLVRSEHEIAALLLMTDTGIRFSEVIDDLPRIHSPIQRVPLGAGAMRRWLMPLYPWAVGRLGRLLAAEHRRRPIDLLISTSSSAIKSLSPPRGVPHLCYCHCPARYVWSRRQDYTSDHSLRSLGLRLVADRYARWDAATADRVSLFVANSEHVAAQIRRFYGRDAVVVHPPVRTDWFTPDPNTPREDFWLAVGAMVPYKRFDLAVEAANRTGHRLVIVGDGPQRRVLAAKAGPSVRLVGHGDEQTLRRLYRRARVLLFPQVEDFGIVAVEAQACGLPVVARRAGGALETVIDGLTGALFDDDSPESLLEAIDRAPDDPDPCRRNAVRFSPDHFDAGFAACIERVIRGTDPAQGGAKVLPATT